MKHIFLAAAVMTGAVAVPAQAQDRMTQVQCEGALGAVADLIGVPLPDMQVQTDAEGWCLIADQSINPNSYQTYRVDSLRWRAGGVERLINDGLPPRSLEVIASGLSFLPQSGDPVMDYLFGLQSKIANTGFGVSVRWDGVQNAVIVDQAYFDFYSGNRIQATARVDGANLTDMATIQTSLGTMGLRDMSITSTFAGWFEGYLAIPLGSQLLQDNDVPPDQQVDALKEQAIAFLDNVPAEVLPDASQTALAAFVTSLPHPRGTLRVQLNANPPLGAVRLASVGMLGDTATPEDIVRSGLDGVALLFTWTATGN